MFRSAASETTERMSLDYWRCVFRGIGTSVFEILENAIRVAATDRPDEFAARRDRIVEALYTCRLRQRCSDCDPAVDEQRGSSSGATAATTLTDGTDAEAEVPGTPGASFLGEGFAADDSLARDSVAADSEIRSEFDEGNAGKPSEEQVPAQSIRREDTGAKRKRGAATNESPEPRDVPNKKHKPANADSKPASSETIAKHSQNPGRSEVLNAHAPPGAAKAATQQRQDDKSLAEKLEASRMRLCDGYRAATKVRTVRVLELHEIPKLNNTRKGSNRSRCERAVSVRFRRNCNISSLFLLLLLLIFYSAATMSSCSLDYWRNVFRSKERSIFEVIEMSIAVAAADRPDELVRRRDGIVKSLYSFPSVAAANGRPEEAEQPAVDATSYCCSSGGGSQKSSSEEADELQDALDDAFVLLDEVLRLKKILDNKNEEDESSLFESLRCLQLMELTVSTLTETDIENSVRGVEGHGSTRVGQLARILLGGWAELRGDSLNTTEAVADAPDTAANSLDDPWVNFPPLDEGALRAINGPPVDLDELFSKNPRKIHKFKRDGVKRADEACKEERKQENNSENLRPICVQGSASGKRKREDAVGRSEPHNTLTKRGRTSNASSKTSGKDLKRYVETMKKDNCELADEPSTVAKTTRQQCSTDDLLIETKLEASRTRIREGYNQAKDEKQRRKIQLLDLRDIPKPVDSRKSCKSMARRDHKRVVVWLFGIRDSVKSQFAIA
uniref:TFIIS N-terminal domain-containing protein n=1 Tax=Ananas comosus var. bracteatus TaxID=296719 RepID=A0A6V7PGE6_ANACO|nr:unnamed protein product [Ananas comosus var. bracteatus]